MLFVEKEGQLQRLHEYTTEEHILRISQTDSTFLGNSQMRDLEGMISMGKTSTCNMSVCLPLWHDAAEQVWAQILVFVFLTIPSSKFQ